MAETVWQSLPAHLQSDMRFQLALLMVHRRIYDHHFARDPMANPALGFHLHGYRRTGNWRIVLVLTPWMFSRLLFSETPPAIEIPEDWRANQRKDADYVLLGPITDPQSQTGSIKSHLNYHASLGHYLLQPIALNMQQYASSDQVFEAWNQVILSRDENMRKAEKECAWQQEISRRELFRKYL